MPVLITSLQNAKAIALDTQYADALLIPAQPFAADDKEFDHNFQALFSKWRQEGYCEEDSATLAVFELTAKEASGRSQDSEGQDQSPDHKGFTKASFYPRLIDQALSDCVKTSRLASKPFAALKDPTPGIYPIVDELSMLSTLLDAGARIIQLRIKSETLTPEIDRAISRAVKLAAQAPDAQLFINDFWQAAIHHGAYGVHLGQEDLLSADLCQIQESGLRLGVSSHAYWEVARALTISPSYVACGPIFPTRAKVMPWIAQGLGNLRYWVGLIPHPVIAIGGINEQNLADIQATGCASASIINAITSDSNPAQKYQMLQSAWISKATHIASNSHGRALAKPTLSQAA